MMLAAGPSASLVCKAWCDPQVAAENGCQRHDVGGSVTFSAVDPCQDAVQGLAVLLKEDVRRISSLDGGGCTPAIVKFQFMTSPESAGAHWNHGRAPSDLQRPLTTPLRV